MIRQILITATFFASLTAFAYPTHEHYWAHRSVILFAPTSDKHVDKFLLGALMNECEIEDRDVITLVITEDGFSEPVWVKHEFNLQAMFEIYQIQPGSYTSILIGKDGMEKSRWSGEIDWQNVNQLIDQMPMRKQEMAQSSSPCAI